MAITYKEEFNLNDILITTNRLSFKDVIDGLNKYFAEDETRVRVPRSCVEISSSDKAFYRFDAEMYLDKLIAWLRSEHGIFYYPGMEAKYAKAEKSIPPFTERMKNDGALRTLKKLHKIVTGEEASDKADSPTLIAAAIENDFAVLKQDLKNALEAKESFFETKGKLAICKELKEYITNESKKYGVDIPEEIDGETITIERTFHDLLEALKNRKAELKEVNEKRWKDLSDIHKALGCGGMNGHVDDFAKAVKARAEYVESLSRNIERSDINKLIRDYCAKNDIVAPSPYFSDKACVEYLFSVVDLEREHRAAVGKQMVEDYKRDLLRSIIDTLRDNGNAETAEALENGKGDKDAIKLALNSIYSIKRGDDND